MHKAESFQRDDRKTKLGYLFTRYGDVKGKKQSYIFPFFSSLTNCVTVIVVLPKFLSSRINLCSTCVIRRWLQKLFGQHAGLTRDCGSAVLGVTLC